MFFGGILLRTFVFATFLCLAGNIHTPDTFSKAENQSCSPKKCFILKHKESPNQTTCKVVTKLVTPIVLHNLTGDPKLANQSKPPEILEDGKPNAGTKSENDQYFTLLGNAFVMPEKITSWFRMSRGQQAMLMTVFIIALIFRYRRSILSKLKSAITVFSNLKPRLKWYTDNSEKYVMKSQHSHRTVPMASSCTNGLHPNIVDHSASYMPETVDNGQLVDSKCDVTQAEVGLEEDEDVFYDCTDEILTSYLPGHDRIDEDNKRRNESYKEIWDKWVNILKYITTTVAVSGVVIVFSVVFDATSWFPRLSTYQQVMLLAALVLVVAFKYRKWTWLMTKSIAVDLSMNFFQLKSNCKLRLESITKSFKLSRARLMTPGSSHDKQNVMNLSASASGFQGIQGQVELNRQDELLGKSHSSVTSVEIQNVSDHHLIKAICSEAAVLDDASSGHETLYECQKQHVDIIDLVSVLSEYVVVDHPTGAAASHQAIEIPTDLFVSGKKQRDVISQTKNAVTPKKTLHLSHLPPGLFGFFGAYHMTMSRDQQVDQNGEPSSKNNVDHQLVEKTVVRPDDFWTTGKNKSHGRFYINFAKIRIPVLGFGGGFLDKKPKKFILRQPAVIDEEDRHRNEFYKETMDKWSSIMNYSTTGIVVNVLVVVPCAMNDIASWLGMSGGQKVMFFAAFNAPLVFKYPHFTLSMLKRIIKPFPKKVVNNQLVKSKYSITEANIEPLHRESDDENEDIELDVVDDVSIIQRTDDANHARTAVTNTVSDRSEFLLVDYPDQGTSSHEAIGVSDDGGISVTDKQNVLPPPRTADSPKQDHVVGECIDSLPGLVPDDRHNCNVTDTSSDISFEEGMNHDENIVLSADRSQEKPVVTAGDFVPCGDIQDGHLDNVEEVHHPVLNRDGGLVNRGENERLVEQVGINEDDRQDDHQLSEETDKWTGIISFTQKYATTAAVVCGFIIIPCIMARRYFK